METRQKVEPPKSLFLPLGLGLGPSTHTLSWDALNPPFWVGPASCERLPPARVQILRCGACPAGKQAKWTEGQTTTFQPLHLRLPSSPCFPGENQSVLIEG